MSEPLAQSALQERLAREGLAPSSWSNGPFDVYGEHRHPYDKVLVAARGSVTFRLPELGREVALHPGARLDLPAGTLHGATVGPMGVVCLEAHLPAGTLAADPRHDPAWGTDDLTWG